MTMLSLELTKKSFLKEFNTNLVRDKVRGGRTQKEKIPAFPRTSISQIMLTLASVRVRFFKKILDWTVKSKKGF